MTGSESRQGPLAGVRVLDLTSVGMGPYATQTLGDMGAEVLKVEGPDGDVFRTSQPAQEEGMGCVYLNFNRNKRSITLDMKQPEDLAYLLSLVDEADVFASNVRPAALRRLGLDGVSLTARNPRLIYCAAVGFGQDGPYAARPAFDDIIQAMCGLADLQGRSGIGSDAGHAPQYVNSIVADKVAGLTLVYAVTAALYERERSGLGQIVEVPMFETMVSFTLPEHMGGATWEPSRGAMGYARVLSRHRKPYRTSDGYMALLPYTDAQWQRFFALSQRGDLADDTRFRTMAARASHFDPLYEELAAIVEKRSTQEWLALLKEADIPHAPVHTLESLLDDEHLSDTGFFRMLDPGDGSAPVRTMAAPVRFSRTPSSVRTAAPRQAPHHTASVPPRDREAGFHSRPAEQAAEQKTHKGTRR